MSVQHEPSGVGRSTERTEAAPELQYHAVNQDSLSMFIAAIAGAILGTALTLLILALINGGTLSYAGERMQSLESHLQQVDENVGAVSANIDIVSAQAAAIQHRETFRNSYFVCEPGRRYNSATSPVSFGSASTGEKLKDWAICCFFSTSLRLD